MKKRIICAITVLTVLVCLFSFATAATTDDATTNFHAGYSIITIDPNYYVNPDTGEIAPITGLPLEGYGGGASRVSEGRMDDTGDGEIDDKDGLFATCVAVTDQYDNTILYTSVDAANTSQYWSNAARRAIVSAVKEANFDIQYNNVFITASHAHSAPDMTYSINDTSTEIGAKCKVYRDWVYDQLGACAVEALEDRSEVVMTKGSVDASEAIVAMKAAEGITVEDGDPTTRMNYVRHYLVYDAEDNFVGAAGSNFGYQKNYNTSGYRVVEVSEPNDTMELVKFTPTNPEKDPIVLANWRAHATINSTTQTAYGGKDHANGGTNYYNVSSDYVNSFRRGLEKSNYRAAFIQGAAGNMTPNTIVKKLQDPEVLGVNATYKTDDWQDEWDDSPIGFLYGTKLARVATYGLDQMADATPLDTTAIRSMSIDFQSTANSLTDDEKNLVTAMNAFDGTIPNYKGTTFDSLISYLIYNDTTWNDRTDYYKDFPYLENINSRYQMSSLKSRYSITDANAKTGLSAISFGKELVFIVTACELSDRYLEVPNAESYFDDETGTFSQEYFEYYLDNPTQNDWNNLTDPETYGTPLVIGYTNGQSGYMPNFISYDYNTGDKTYAPGSYESQKSSFAQRSGEDLMNTFSTLVEGVSGDAVIRCECGDLLEDTNAIGHVCSDMVWTEWTKNTALPSNGNYILTEDVTITSQHTVNGELHLDLNGHNITFEVPADKTDNTRVFNIKKGGYLSITDSSDGTPGTVTRDVSQWSEDQNKANTNVGLIALIDTTAGEGDGFTLYNGTLNAAGGITGNGSVIGNLGSNADSVFKMYGGTITGGIANYGAIYSKAKVEIYGGTITGNTTKGGTNSNYCGGVFISENGSLKIGGDVNITGNTKTYTDSNDVVRTAATNIRFAQDSYLEEKFTVVGEFSGKAGLVVSAPVNNKIVGISEDAAFGPDNLDVDNASTYIIGVNGEDLVLYGKENYCECGGTVTTGTHGHVCKDQSWAPWSDTESLPTKGNYYLTDDVTVSIQTGVSGDLRLDLNGHNITRKVYAGSKNTRVFVVEAGDYLSITDSTTVDNNTATPGKITRDLSSWSEEDQKGITNYGLIVLLSEKSTNGCTIYNGTFDSSGAYTNGGSILANLSKNGAVLKVYDGEFIGGISDSGSIITYAGAELYGGYIHGGKSKTSDGAPGVYVTKFDDAPHGTLIIGGDVRIKDNTRSNERQTNIRFASLPRMANGFTVTSDFNGEAGIYVDPRRQSQDVGNTSVDATFTKANLYLDYWTDYNIIRDGTNLLLDGKYAATIIDGENVTHYETLAETITQYADASTDAYISLVKDNKETNITFTRDTVLDLNSCDLNGKATVANGFTLQLADSATDDYTTEDGVYGKVMADAVAGTVCGLNSNLSNPGNFYLAYTEDDNSTSYHRVNLEIVGITLRPDSRNDGTYHPGVYYNAQFGGDEQVKEMVDTFGIALGANEVPTFDDDTFTSITADGNWNVGMDESSGYSNNLSNGTLLKDILQTTNPFSVNMRNAKYMVNGQAYIQLKDGGKRVIGPMVSYSLKNVMEGVGETATQKPLPGLDKLWNNQSATTKNNAINLYKTFTNIMKPWSLPNIKSAVAASAVTIEN